MDYLKKKIKPSRYKDVDQNNRIGKLSFKKSSQRPFTPSPFTRHNRNFPTNALNTIVCRFRKRT